MSDSASSLQAGFPAAAAAADVPLSSLTTLELGGPARWVFTPASEPEIGEIRAWAGARGLPMFVLGGGSNVVAADAGFAGVVVRSARLRGVRFTERGDDEVWVSAAAGEPWDELVTTCVAQGLAGIECLAGIPGLVGATPIQNVGAYGQEVAETIREVRAVALRQSAESKGREVVDGGVVDGDGERGGGEDAVTFSREACQFDYRDSLFRRQPGRYMVVTVTFALRRAAPPSVRYPELASALSISGGAAPSSPLSAPARPSLAQVSETVRALRRSKSMLLDPHDPNRRSVGSFFMNPIVSAAQAATLTMLALHLGHASEAHAVPQFPLADGRVKLSAAWLIEHAGFARGTRRGTVAISSRHALALVHHGGGTTADLLSLAREIRQTVFATFGISLTPEPILLGVGW